MGELQAWVKKTSPALCMFQPQPQPPPNVDKATNDAHFKSLIALLMSKKVVRRSVAVFRFQFLSRLSTLWQHGRYQVGPGILDA